MSVAVSLEELARRVEEYGSVAFLVTTDGTGSHVVSVRVTFDGRRFTMHAGSTSRRNLASSASATLLWPSPDAGPYCLLVDGSAGSDEDVAWVEPTRAVLHRLADADPDLPSCVRLEPDR
jgi:hypothetical protein